MFERSSYFYHSVFMVVCYGVIILPDDGLCGCFGRLGLFHGSLLIGLRGL